MHFQNDDRRREMKNDFSPYLDLNAFVSYKFYGLHLNWSFDSNNHFGTTEASKQASNSRIETAFNITRFEML